LSRPQHRRGLKAGSEFFFTETSASKGFVAEGELGMMERVVVTKRRTWWGWGSISSLEIRPHKQWRHSSTAQHHSHYDCTNNRISFFVKSILLRLSNITSWEEDW